MLRLLPSLATCMALYIITTESVIVVEGIAIRVNNFYGVVNKAEAI